MTVWQAHVLYALAWLAFGVVHSILAGEAVKSRMQPLFGRGYRLAYNVFAVVHTAATIAFGAWVFPELRPFDLPAWLYGIQFALFAGGCVLMAAGARQFDMGLFSGLAQVRGKAEDEPLRTEGLLGRIRHPLFAAGFLLLWGSAVNEVGLATAIWGSVYLYAGSRFEERRLLRLYGQPYADYLRRVPAFAPWRRSHPPSQGG
jgi:protein-S-isoprenylcysteine O-methyltransferase Ste14